MHVQEQMREHTQEQMNVEVQNLIEVSADHPAGATLAARAIPAAPESAPLAAICQAMVVFPRAGKRGASLSQGWAWTFANTPLSGLLNQWLTEARLTWAATLVPRAHTVAFDALARNTPGRRIAYDHALPLPTSPRPLSEDALLVVVNAHQFPLCDLRRAIDIHRASRCDATFISACPLDPRSPYDEKLLVDEQGHVRRVDRLYGHAPARTEPEWPSLIILSGEALARLNGATLPPSLIQWAASLVRLGLRINGASIPGVCFDLRDTHQVQDLARAVLRDRPHWLVDDGNLTRHAPRVWIGANVTIDPTAELIGPIAIGDGASIGAGAVIVGPTVIGQGASIGASAILRQAVVAPNTTVDSQSRTPGRAPRPQLDAGSSLDHAIRLQTVIEAAGQPTPLANFRHAAYKFIKRALDILGSIAFLLFTLPVIPFIALAIKLDTRGPIFYGHIRQGLRGRPFRCWKFRTMIHDAEHAQQALRQRNEVDGPQFKIRQDPRITRVGAILRRFNIDEWPQFFNILVGEMALVGPRPSPESENCICPAWREARLSVRPGLTGLWQVSRRREEETDFQEWIYYDVQYVKKQSLYLDLLILLKTVRVALKGT